jgi:hypothetical protein
LLDAPAKQDYIGNMAQLHASLPTGSRNEIEIGRDDADADRVKALVDEGIASGVIDQDPRTIIARLIADDPDLRR